MDEANFNYYYLEIIAVDRSRKTPDDLQKGFELIRVPTFIFYKKGKEIGRFVEYPKKSVEADFLKILNGKRYKHAYYKR